jgi:AcrR family transcriptional regulator
MTAMSTTAATGHDNLADSAEPRPGRRLTADARRRQLFDVALSLFAEHGYSATTMDDIAEAAGVTKPLVYQHFDSKRALYLELLDVVSHELIDRIVQSTAVAEGPRQQVELGFAGYFELMVDNELAFRPPSGGSGHRPSDRPPHRRRPRPRAPAAFGPCRSRHG